MATLLLHVLHCSKFKILQMIKNSGLLLKYWQGIVAYVFERLPGQRELTLNGVDGLLLVEHHAEVERTLLQKQKKMVFMNFITHLLFSLHYVYRNTVY